MTEITKNRIGPPMQLPPLTEAFVLHFGEMGVRWGVNRTVGQIYALLYLADEPLNAEQISDALGFSRSNVSMGLKELDVRRLIKLKHLPGDRRDYFTTPEDLWEIVRALAEDRRKREIEPTLTMLREALLEHGGTKSDDAAAAYALKRMKEMHDLIETLTKWYEEMRSLETERLEQLLALGSTVLKLIELKDRFSFSYGKSKDAPFDTEG